MLPQQQPVPITIMRKFTTFPQSEGVGRLYVGDVIDAKFQADDVITWENTKGRGGLRQRFGWQDNDKKFANQTIRVSFWIKFLHQVRTIFLFCRIAPNKMSINCKEQRQHLCNRNRCTVVFESSLLW